MIRRTADVDSKRDCVNAWQNYSGSNSADRSRESSGGRREENLKIFTPPMEQSSFIITYDASGNLDLLTGESDTDQKECSE